VELKVEPGGTADIGLDFLGLMPYVTFEPGQSSKTVYVELPDDYQLEGTQTVELTLVTPDTHIFSVSDERFEVLSGQLKLKNGISLDYEAVSTLSFDITATDNGGASFTESFTLNITDVNETSSVVTVSQRIPSINSNFEVGGIADFDGDGKADILWRNPSDGRNFLWGMDGSERTSSVGITTIDSNFEVGGIADFDGDGKADILWRDSVSGNNTLWLMDGLNSTGL
jgi:hypothetical protein